MRRPPKPVRLPPGRLRLATRPNSTGSRPTKKTIGIVEVSGFRRERRNAAAC
jgi:hypothetical protein